MIDLVLILAGGASRRMGRDKAALPFGDGTMLTHLVEEFSRRWPVAVSVGEAGRYDTAGAPEICDLHPGQGPLAGLEAAFSQRESDVIFLTGTDLPFVTAELAGELEKRFLPELDALVIRRRDGKTEPLCGLYRRTCLKPVKACLTEGRRSFHGLFRRIRVGYLEEDDLSGFDLDGMLDNLNTPEEYRRRVEN